MHDKPVWIMNKGRLLIRHNVLMNTATQSCTMLRDTALITSKLLQINSKISRYPIEVLQHACSFSFLLILRCGSVVVIF